jgi:pimeloyl-ACP methyl ester carboxylesterase
MTTRRARRETRYAPVERVIALPGVGHCPHDEAPELVNPLIIEFVQRVAAARA